MSLRIAGSFKANAQLHTLPAQHGQHQGVDTERKVMSASCREAIKHQFFTIGQGFFSYLFTLLLQTEVILAHTISYS